MSDRNVKTVHEACVHDRYERHQHMPTTNQDPTNPAHWIHDPSWRDPWGEGKNTLELEREFWPLPSQNTSEQRWVSEWEPVNE